MVTIYIWRRLLNLYVIIFPVVADTVEFNNNHLIFYVLKKKPVSMNPKHKFSNNLFVYIPHRYAKTLKT